ncbi:DUF3322 domain-containing protein [Desulfoplanes sp.]
MSWTLPSDIRVQVHRFWERGVLPRALFRDENLFPLRLRLKAPGSRDLSERFGEVRDWIGQLARGAGKYRIEWKTLNHRTLGANEIPARLWIDTLNDCLDLIGRQREAGTLRDLVGLTREIRPEMLSWVENHPLKVLELAGDWERLLDVVTWMREHPRPGVYLRQVDLPGVHTKFIENHRGVLAGLLDRSLPPEAIDHGAGRGVGCFCKRYGFRDKPLRVRFRILDPRLAIVPTTMDQDITLTREAFAGLDIPVRRIFITENEINFLAFPPCPHSMVIFGAGYGFDNLAQSRWLATREIHYWGDIDTHGFAILNQLRKHFPHARSLLMDNGTLLAHKEVWGVESRPETAELERLTPEEAMLYEDLWQNRWGEQVRLEQERIGFNILKNALETMNTL